jgi:O-acetyl-ADP-ribose deacetylase (regulator of RNase III)
MNIETRLQQHIAEQHDGELPVGQAAVLATEHGVIAFLVSAPTMRVPGDIRSTVNAYLAFRAALLAVRRHNAACGAGARIRSLLSPALGTGIGRMSHARAARQMVAAYRAVVLGEQHAVASQILQQHRELLR